MPRWLTVALGCSLLMLTLCFAALWRISTSPVAALGHIGTNLVAAPWGTGTNPAAGLPDYGPAPHFTLTDQSGQPFGSDQLDGKVAVVGFIYTHCPDICPMLTAQMRQLQNQLAGAGLLGEKTVLLSITVDPERDTPEVLARYAEQFDADPAAWYFLTGELTTVRQAVVDGFRLAMGKEDVEDDGHTDSHSTESRQGPGASHSTHDGHAGADSYIVSHSGRLVLVDGRGHIRAYYDGTDLDLNQVVADIRFLSEPDRVPAPAYPHQEEMP